MARGFPAKRIPSRRCLSLLTLKLFTVTPQSRVDAVANVESILSYALKNCIVTKVLPYLGLGWPELDIHFRFVVPCVRTEAFPGTTAQETLGSKQNLTDYFISEWTQCGANGSYEAANLMIESIRILCRDEQLPVHRPPCLYKHTYGHMVTKVRTVLDPADY